jgi:hypothetical protein
MPGTFTKQPAESWTDGYLGFDWATTEARVYAADFNGDRLADLLIQAEPTQTSSNGLAQPARFLPNMNGVVLAKPDAKPFALEGVQAWSRDGFKADWSPLSSAVLTGDFTGMALDVPPGRYGVEPQLLPGGQCPRRHLHHGRAACL